VLLHHHFVHIAKKFSKKFFIIDRTANKRITYSEALIASLLLTNRFQQYEEGFVGIMIPTSAGCMLSILATLMSGRIPVMINYSTGAAYNAEFAQKKCNFKTIITSKAFLKKINCPHIKGMIFLEDIMASITPIEKCKALLISKLTVRLILHSIAGGDENDDLVILFTSGSEKDPKAVQLTHRNIIANVQDLNAVFKLSVKDSMLANLPYFHVFGQTANLWIPIYQGMTIISYADPTNYKMICQIIRVEKPTLMVGTPCFYRGYLHKSEPGDFDSIRIAITGADKCPDILRRAFLTKHNLTLHEAYGTTETSPGISVNTPKFNKPGSVGKVLPNVWVRIENYNTGEECAPGEEGKIFVKGDLVMKGYLDDLEETALHLRNGWYDTGDIGLIDDDGYLWHVGRLKRFVKIGGEMISLVRVENIIEKLLPENISCCIVEFPDAFKGAKIVAAVTQPVDERAILKQMATQLPNIALPKHFVVLDELPKMGSGKIDFRTTTEMVREILAN